MPSSADSDGDREDGEYEDDLSLAEFLESEVLGDEDETPETLETLDDEKSDGGSLASPGVETDSDAVQVGWKIGQVCMHVGELVWVLLIHFGGLRSSLYVDYVLVRWATHVAEYCCINSVSAAM